MNWLTRTISKVFPRKKKSLDIPENTWIKCKNCSTMLYYNDLDTEQAQFCCTNCDTHLIIEPQVRLKYLLDHGYEVIEYEAKLHDPLSFKSIKSYKELYAEARVKTNLPDTFLIANGKINGVPATVCAQSFSFLGGSIGANSAEAFIKSCEHAVSNQLPLVCFISSGGARLQENQFSLQALPKMTVGVSMLRDAKLPFIVVNTWPSTGGVQASIGSLGTITLAEPGALIGFAGRRVITQNTPESDFPPDFQLAEGLLKNGMIDMIVHRREMKYKISQIITLLMKKVA